MMINEHWDRWPQGTSSALCLSFDIDAETMWTSVDPESARRPSLLSQATYELEIGIPLVLKFLAARGLRTTFFVPGLVAEQHSDAIQAIVEEGHEVACHGYDHVSHHGLTESEERTLIAKSLDALEQVTGTRPVGYRAPLFEMNTHTTALLRTEGLRYSSNQSASLWPYQHPGRDGALIEIPVHPALDDGPYFLYSRTPPNYRQFYAPSAVLEIWSEELAAISRLGGVTTLVLHPQLIGRPSRLGILERLIGLAEDIPRLWMPRMSDLAECVASNP